jgi:1,4-dihydroxy-2-naphthoate octaprenyltransferase
MPSWRQVRLFLLLSRPWFLVGAALLYALGLAMAHYLGESVSVPLAAEGLAFVMALQLTVHYLNEYFDADADAANPNRTPFNGGSGVVGKDRLSRLTALQAAVIAVAFIALLLTALLIRGDTSILAWAVIALMLPASLFYSAPPLRLVSSGYGEFIAALIVSAMVPTLAFTLQTGSMHRMLFLATAPLVLLNFAMIMAFEVPDYGTDLQSGKRTLMVRLGWENGMRLHDAAIIGAVVVLLAGVMLGMPAHVSVGLLIVLPLAAAQAWQMGRVRRGAKPNWILLTGGAVALYSLAAYLTFAGFATS